MSPRPKKLWQRGGRSQQGKEKGVPDGRQRKQYIAPAQQAQAWGGPGGPDTLTLSTTEKIRCKLNGEKKIEKTTKKTGREEERGGRKISGKEGWGRSLGRGFLYRKKNFTQPRGKRGWGGWKSEGEEKGILRMKELKQ